MNKLINFITVYFSLFIVEIILIFTLLLVIEFPQYDFRLSYIESAIYGTELMNYWRILFYGLPFIILYIVFFKYVKKMKLYRPLSFSLFNLFIHISLSVLSRFIIGKNIPLPPQGIMFWVTCPSIFLSPLILGQVRYFKKLMDTL